MVGEARTPETDAGPLEGITVLDLSRVLVGPFCTMQLGDLGADVIKVERPGVGDPTRGYRPPTFGGQDAGGGDGPNGDGPNGDGDGEGDGHGNGHGGGEESAYYLAVNRNKRSIELDLKTEAGRAVLADLAAEADVLVENFRVGTMEDWGLGYASLREDNPGLIYAKVSGYGEWGPDRDAPAFDIMMQARGGMMSITGEEGGPPVRVGVAIADLTAAMYAFGAILAALYHRDGTGGTGQKLDLSLLDCQAALMSHQALNYFATGEVPRRMGSRHPNITPYQAYEVADGAVVVAVASEAMWPRFCRAIGREDLLDDARFATNADRVEHRDALDGLVEEAIGDREVEAVVEAMGEHDVPACAVHDLEAVFDDPQVRARGMRTTVEHPSIGEVPMPNSPLFFSRTPARIERHPPALGEHTAGLLREYGYDEGDIAALRDAGAISDPSA